MANYNASLLHESINLNKSTIRDTDAGHIWSSYIVKLHARLSDANTIDWEIGQINNTIPILTDYFIFADDTTVDFDSHQNITHV